MSRTDMIKKTATKKGLMALGLGVLSTVVAIYVSPYIAALGFVGTGYLAYKWFTYRGEHGLRF